MENPIPWPLALERYTQLVPAEVLRVEVEVEGQPDIVLIFKGFSSSLMRTTPADASQPVIPLGARFISLDRLKAPYTPVAPRVLASRLDIPETQALLRSARWVWGQTFRDNRDLPWSVKGHSNLTDCMAPVRLL